jgi:hypothetical protein
MRLACFTSFAPALSQFDLIVDNRILFVCIRLLPRVLFILNSLPYPYLSSFLLSVDISSLSFGAVDKNNHHPRRWDRCLF